MPTYAEQFKLYNVHRRPADATRFCQAPFNNLYFGNRGIVVACCSNRLHILGNYPQQSISEIWNGEAAKSLRLAMNNNDFTKGCQACYMAFDAGNFRGMPANVYDNHTHVGTYPKRMEFELSNTCNLECIMCSGELSSSIRERRDKKPPIPSPYDDAFLKQLDEYIPYLQTAQFLGGEPFLIPIYFQIWERMTELNPDIRISIQTNGTILNARVKELLGKLKVSISVSIDSIDTQTYPVVRKNGDLERVMRHVEWFSEYVKEKQTGMSISFCPMQQNWKELPDMVKYANQLGASIFFNSVFIPAECSLMALPTHELEAITAYLQQQAQHLPQGNELEQANYNMYLNTIAFIENIKANEVSIERNISIEEYLEAAEHFVNEQQNLSMQDKLSTYASISQKVRYMVAKAEGEGIKQEMERALVSITLPALFQYFAAFEDKDRLYQMIKERLLNIIEQ